jgi:hypothetical protein
MGKSSQGKRVRRIGKRETVNAARKFVTETMRIKGYFRIMYIQPGRVKVVSTIGGFTTFELYPFAFHGAKAVR